MPIEAFDEPVNIPDAPGAPAAVETPAPATTPPPPATPPAPTAESEKPTPVQVPLAAVLEERQKRQALQRQLEETARKTEAMEKRFQELLQRDKPAAPAFEENPAEHLKARLDEVETKTRKLDEVEAQTAQERARQQDVQALTRFVESAEAGYRQQTKDYDAAIKHLQTVRAQEFMALGYSPSEAQELVYRDALAIAWEARQRESNPAELYYRLAKLRGYAPAPAVQATPEKTLEKVARGLEKAGGLGPSGGDDGELTLAKLAEMDDEAFSKATSGTNWRKLMGG